MTDYTLQRIDFLTHAVQQISTALAQVVGQSQSLAKELQETRTILEALGQVHELEWVDEVKSWVDVAKLKALRAHPRGEN